MSGSLLVQPDVLNSSPVSSLLIYLEVLPWNFIAWKMSLKGSKANEEGQTGDRGQKVNGRALLLKADSPKLFTFLATCLGNARL